MKMMKIEAIVGDIVLLVLNNHDPLQKVGIDQDKIFVKIKGYDENGIWIHHPNFNVPDIEDKKRKKTKRVEASVLIAWPFIISIVHFPGTDGFDLPSPFEKHIGFN